MRFDSTDKSIADSSEYYSCTDGSCDYPPEWIIDGVAANADLSDSFCSRSVGEVPGPRLSVFKTTLYAEIMEKMSKE